MSRTPILPKILNYPESELDKHRLRVFSGVMKFQLLMIQMIMLGHCGHSGHVALIRELEI